jgi:hypothetical protein
VPRCASLRFVAWADRKVVAGALKPLYTAENEDAALAEFEKLEHKHGDKYPTVIRTFRSRWEQFVPFLSYPQEIRRMLYTTNAVESLNSQLRKVLRNRGPFPNEDAVFKVLFLAIQNAETRWRANKNWNRVLSQLDIFFEGRLPAPSVGTASLARLAPDASFCASRCPERLRRAGGATETSRASRAEPNSLVQQSCHGRPLRSRAARWE